MWARKILFAAGGVNTLRHFCVTQELIDSFTELLPSPLSQPVVLDISGFELENETVFARLRTLLLAIMNRAWQLPQLGYRKDQSESSGKLWLRVKVETAAAHLLVMQTQAIADGMLLSRQLADRPASDCTPVDIAHQAKTWASLHPQTFCEVLDETDIEQLGMGCLLATGKGSCHPPRLVTLRWLGGKR